MTDLEYAERADALLQSVESRCDQICDNSDIDIDSQRSGGMITLTFPNGSQIILNKQAPLQEVWLAARSGGYHFKWADNAWRDTKGQGELLAILGREAAVQAGTRLDFGA
jgi:CyaY protein